MDIAHITFTINGRTYVANDIEDITPDKRRLILSLSHRLLSCVTMTDAIKSAKLMENHCETIMNIFTQTFPDASDFKEIQDENIGAMGWKLIVLDVQDKHIKWAQAARECGLIDSYVSDYDPGR